jgi:predicted transcriptional regulator YheO
MRNGKRKRPAGKAGKLSGSDRLIIDSYITTMEGLAFYFGGAFEFVLHDITDFDHSIIKIINGSLSGRREGSPITDLALSMLEKIQANDASKQFMCYTSKSKYGRPVKSTTIVIFGARKKAIGLLCVNLYLDSPLTSLLQSFSPDSGTDYVTENFSSDSDELIANALEKVKGEVDAADSVPPHLKNKEIITILYHQGIFKLKNAVRDISRELGISKSTVYLHIRALEEKA